MEKIGKYEVREKIGVGGFGEVYKGYDPFIKRPVAIKTCSSTDQDIRNRFFQEAEIAGNLHHRNITTVYDFGVQDGLPYLIQEYLSGEDLDRKVKRRDYLPFAEKLYYLLQVARGLGHAHSKGVIHRDIKPANIRILEDGTAKIMDFGIAKLAQQDSGLTQTGMTLGTAAYLAPEQIRGEDVDLRTDVFSFGILAFELLAYERPFQGKQISVVLHQILDVEAPPVSEKWPAAPPEVVAFIDRCLRKDPGERFADGNALLRELEKIQKHGRNDRPGADDQPTVQLDQDLAARQKQGVTRTQGAVEAVAPTAARARPKPEKAPTIDDIEFSLSGSVDELRAESAVAAARPGRSRAGTVAVLALLAALAVGGGWWLGTQGRSGGPATEGTGEPTADVGSSPAGDGPGAAEAAEGALPESLQNEPAAEGAGEAAGAGEPGAGAEPAAEDEAAPPAVDEPEVEEPPPPPSTGRVEIAGVDWTDRMTVQIGGRTYPLTRGWEIELKPGNYEAVFETQIAGYAERRTVQVTVTAGEKGSLTSPILRPGALSVRPLPGRSQGEVWIDGRLLRQSPIRRDQKAPGEYRIEIRPAGGGDPLVGQVEIAPGQETILTFDFGRGELNVSTKPLAQ